MLYAAVTTSFNGFGGPGTARSTVPCSSSTRSPASWSPRSRCRRITPNYFCYYPYGFSIASDGTFWIPQPNSEQHHPRRCQRQRARQLLRQADYLPESASIGADGNVYFSTDPSVMVYQLNPTTGAVNFFASTASPFGTLTSTAPAAPASGPRISTTVLSATTTAATCSSSVGYFGTNNAQDDPVRQRLDRQLRLLGPVPLRPESATSSSASFAPGAYRRDDLGR